MVTRMDGSLSPRDTRRGIDNRAVIREDLAGVVNQRDTKMQGPRVGDGRRQPHVDHGGLAVELSLQSRYRGLRGATLASHAFLRNGVLSSPVNQDEHQPPRCELQRVRRIGPGEDLVQLAQARMEVLDVGIVRCCSVCHTS